LPWTSKHLQRTSNRLQWTSSRLQQTSNRSNLLRTLKPTLLQQHFT
jgi:hypothetical protein